jgi:SAM-dependent methyltransferase
VLHKAVRFGRGALRAGMAAWFRERLVAGRRPTVAPQLRYPTAAVSTYYQQIHQSNEAYRINNWLLSEVEAILSIGPKSVLEVGCGNGRFLAAIRDRVDQAIGVDWAKSPILDELGLSSHFQLRDITHDDLPKADLVCSADVLEHVAPNLLRSTLQRLHNAGREQYHVIACYDDGHSHLSIMEPEAWLHAFMSISDRYRIIDIRPRRDDPHQTTCVIATFNPRVGPSRHLDGGALGPP